MLFVLFLNVMMVRFRKERNPFYMHLLSKLGTLESDWLKIGLNSGYQDLLMSIANSIANNKK